MTFKEYIILFDTLITGLAMAKILNGVSYVLVNKIYIRTNHILTICAALMLLMNHWWFSFMTAFETYITSVFGFVFHMIYILPLYLLSTFVFPDREKDQVEEVDTQPNYKALFYCLMGYISVAMIQKYIVNLRLTDDASLFQFIAEYPFDLAVRLIILVGAILGIRSQNETVIRFLLIFLLFSGLMYWGYFSFVELEAPSFE